MQSYASLKSIYARNVYLYAEQLRKPNLNPRHVLPTNEHLVHTPTYKTLSELCPDRGKASGDELAIALAASIFLREVEHNPATDGRSGKLQIDNLPPEVAFAVYF